MPIQIQLRRGTAAQWANTSTGNPILAQGEMGIETDTQLFKIGTGLLTWNELPYGGLRGFAGSTGYVGSQGSSMAVNNVLYVSRSGTDTNSGVDLSQSKLTIKAALQVATTGTTIFVKSGDYIEDNPLTVPDMVSIIGDNLRTVIVRPANTTTDLFYVNNGAYLAHMTFKDHEAPAAAVAFDPNGSAGVIFMSPYVQNCTSMTTNGTGMRVDGNHAQGTRSMVVDAFTQYNQGGIGIHMLNRGYTQLVSVFTICCDKAILCESGGNCSITNSNASFGNYGLYADGVSNALYSGKTRNTSTVGTKIIAIDNLSFKPKVGDAVYFSGGNTGTYFTVASATDLSPGSTTLTQPYFLAEPASLRNARGIILGMKSKVQVDTIDYINETYPGFDYDQGKCTRDVGYIIQAVADDMVLNTNYKSVYAGASYYRAMTTTLATTTQKTQTLAAIEFVKNEILNELLSSFSNTSTAFTRVSDNFFTITNILSSGTDVVPPLVYNDPVGASIDRIRAKDILRANRQFLIEEGYAYINALYPALVYNTSSCRRDMGYIIDAVCYDLLYQGNSETINAGDEYYQSGVLQIGQSELIPTIATYNYLGQVAGDCVVNTAITPINSIVAQNTSYPAASSSETSIVTDLFGIVVELLENGYSSTVTFEETVPPTAANTTATFYEYSLITSSGHTFEWVGAGTNINTALPTLGGIPVPANQVVQVNGGQVYYTSTDQRGDFRIGNDFVINRKTGTITGRTFTKSLFAVMTPYILAIGT